MYLKGWRGMPEKEVVVSLSDDDEDKLFEMINEIFSGLAHDLRGPLQTIKNCIYLLEIEPDDRSPLKLIDDSVGHLTSLLERFREYHRGHKVASTETSFNALVEHAIKQVDVPEGIRVIQELDPETGEAQVDIAKMGQALRHVIQSAVDAMPDGGELRVKTLGEPKGVTVIISDTGETIPDSVKADLFKPFATKFRDEDGLSLPSCQRIVRAHGGEIDIENEGGGGTTFIIRLPR
jgi:signal transduction histidine kinase